MKTTIINATVFAAAFMATAGRGTAQTLKADVPFAFETSAGRMQAGTYDVLLSRSQGGQPMIQLREVDSHRAVVRLVNPAYSGSPARVPAVMTFACADGRCALKAVRDESGNVYNLSSPKPGSNARIAEVRMKSDRAD